MWFIFPQLAGLGHSETARYYSIQSEDEAKAYLEHPVLGPRLTNCTALVNAVADRTLDQIFGYPDNLKFYSCMTLFRHVEPATAVFSEALEKYCGGVDDPKTLSLL
jgi:uncharacterized protein (DUF1810 family)